jgi:flagellar FliL protein
MAVEETIIAPVAEPKGGAGRKLLIGGAVVAVLAIAGVGVALFLNDDAAAPVEESPAAKADEPPSPALYTSLHPPLVVNLRDSTGAQHFMQVTLEVMARKQDVINAVRDHTPVIRNSLILLYGSELYEDVVTRAGKEKMLADGLTEVRRVMKQQAAVSGIEALYFTNLIIQ